MDGSPPLDAGGVMLHAAGDSCGRVLHVNGGQLQSQHRQRQRCDKIKANMSANQGAEALF